MSSPEVIPVSDDKTSIVEETLFLIGVPCDRLATRHFWVDDWNSIPKRFDPEQMDASN